MGHFFPFSHLLSSLTNQALIFLLYSCFFLMNPSSLILFALMAPKHNGAKGMGTKLSVQKNNKPMPPINYNAFLNQASLSNYTNYFSKDLLFVERHVNANTLYNVSVGHNLFPIGWKDFMSIKGILQEEAMHIFYTNIHASKITQLYFRIEVYGVHMEIDPDVISTLLGIDYPDEDVVEFPPTGINKVEILALFSQKEKHQFGKLTVTEYNLKM